MVGLKKTVAASFNRFGVMRDHHCHERLFESRARQLCECIDLSLHFSIQRGRMAYSIPSLEPALHHGDFGCLGGLHLIAHLVQFRVDSAPITKLRHFDSTKVVIDHLGEKVDLEAPLIALGSRAVCKSGNCLARDSGNED